MRTFKDCYPVECTVVEMYTGIYFFLSQYVAFCKQKTRNTITCLYRNTLCI